MKQELSLQDEYLCYQASEGGHNKYVLFCYLDDDNKSFSSIRTQEDLIEKIKEAEKMKYIRCVVYFLKEMKFSSEFKKYIKQIRKQEMKPKKVQK